MINLKNFFSLISVIGTKKSYLFFLVFLMLISSVADILSLGLIVPYVSQILNLQNNSFDFLPFDLEVLETYPNDNLIFFFTVLLIVIFFFKGSYFNFNQMDDNKFFMASVFSFTS